MSHQAGEYAQPDLPDNVHEVRLSVYKLEITGIGVVDRLGAGFVGAYHSAVVVGSSEEWAFGGHDVAGKSGVYRTKPELNPDYIFFRREIMGTVHGDHRAIGQQIRQMARTEKWGGPCYDLIERNCNHFSSDLIWMLMRKRPPDWVNATASSMSLTRRRTAAEHVAFQAALEAYDSEVSVQASPFTSLARTFLGSTADKRPPQEQWLEQMMAVPGAKAFADSFASTFELSWSSKRSKERIAAAGDPEKCQRGEDPEALKSEEERKQLAAAGAAALTAAKVVACAARAGAAARARQPAGAAQTAWDRAWARGTQDLLKAWRAQAVAGKLDADPNSAQGLERARLVEATLAVAAQQAAAALEQEQRLAARREELERRVEERTGRPVPPLAAATTKATL